MIRQVQLRPDRRGRLLFVIGGFALVFGLVLARLVQLGVADSERTGYIPPPPSLGRPSILDRNGNLLAIDVPSSGLYAEPRLIVDVDEAVEKLTAIFPDIDRRDLYRRLKNGAAFAWIKRQVTPAEEQAAWNAGIPAIGFQREKQRFYPNGSLAAHVLGTVDIDNIGIAGIERWIERQGLEVLRQSGMDLSHRNLEPVSLTLDIRIQHALETELRKAIVKFSAKAGAGLVLDVSNGEILALVSYPDFDPNLPVDALKPDRINRIAAATFEMGSTFKALTTAMALDSGKFTLRSVVDASKPLAFGRFRINDYRGQYRPLTLPEAFIYSSNISMAKMAIAIGPQNLRTFLTRFGQMSRLTTELPESAHPQLPRRWGEIDTATASYGHGIAVTPLQASIAVAALVNGGRLIRPTLIKGAPLEDRLLAHDLIKPETGEALRYLLRLNAKTGSAKKAEIKGYFIGGKTGTAEKVIGGRYSKELNITSFMGIVPVDKPRYLLLTLLDEPKGLPETYGFRTSGWNAVPLGGAVFERILPMLALMPDFEIADVGFPEISSQGVFGSQLFPSSAGAGERDSSPIDGAL